MKERGKVIYLDQMWRDSSGRCSQNLLLKFWTQMHYGGWKFKMVWNFLIFHYLIEKFWKFNPLSIVLTVFYCFGPFELIWCCRSPFWVHFDHVFDPFVHILGIMSKLAYRLGFHIRLHFAWPYDYFILTLGTNPFHLVTFMLLLEVALCEW